MYYIIKCLLYTARIKTARRGACILDGSAVASLSTCKKAFRRTAHHLAPVGGCVRISIDLLQHRRGKRLLSAAALVAVV